MLKIVTLGLLLFPFACVTSQKSIETLPISTEVELAPLIKGHTRDMHDRVGSKFVITSSGEGASDAGRRMYALGGNIYDAFAAVSFAISVERPQSTGLGGGGFAMIYDPARGGKVEAVDFRERAPLRATERMFLDAKGEVIEGLSTDSIFSVATPGLVAGVTELQQKYGKLKLSQILAPAIELAEKGFEVYPHLATAIELRLEVLKRHPVSRDIFLDKNHRPLKVGDRLIQKDLAKTLRLIARYGKRAFYQGQIRDLIVRESKRQRGLLTNKDFSDYKVRYRSPVAKGSYRGYDILSMPPPSSGGAHVVQILNIVEPLNLRQYGPFHPFSVHMTSAAMQQAFADRASYLGDSDFVKVPLSGLTSKTYANEILRKIPRNAARRVGDVTAMNPLPYESDETTHFSIADATGAMISSTQTINGLMGSGIVAAGTGIVLNNEMDDFSAKAGSQNLFGAVGGLPNKIEAGKRPLSSMAPTIVLRNGKPYLALGTPSGTRILTCVALTIMNLLEYRLPLYEAVAAVRYHHQWQPDVIRYDHPGLPQGTTSALNGIGYQLSEQDLGCKVNAVQFEESGRIRGVSDPRSEGLTIAL